jgi:3-methyladenine DNA glycosylase Mpg
MVCCQALGITREEDHNIDVTLRSSHIQVLDDGNRPGKIVATPRIGITKGVDLPLQFLVRDV